METESKRSTIVGNKPCGTSSGMIADWLTLYAKVYREEISEELVLAYQMVLGHLKADLLHAAFSRCLRRSKFRPTPAEVLESVDDQLSDLSPSRLQAPPMTEDEKEECRKISKEFRKRMGPIAVPPR